MSRISRMTVLAVACLVCALLWSAPRAQAATFTAYAENFDAYATGALNGQNGWTTLTATPQVIVGDTGGTDKVTTQTGTTLVASAIHQGLYALPGGTEQIVFEARMRMRGGFGNRVNFVGAAGTDIVGFGAGFGGFNFVIVDAADTKLFSGNASGGNALSSTSHAYYDTIFTVDFNGAADATGTFAVRKDGQASFQTLVSGLDLQLSSLYENPLNWSGLLLEWRTSSDVQDDFEMTVAYMPVPEPSSLLLGALGLVGLGLIRRQRR